MSCNLYAFRKAVITDQGFVWLWWSKENWVTGCDVCHEDTNVVPEDIEKWKMTPHEAIMVAKVIRCDCFLIKRLEDELPQNN